MTHPDPHPQRCICGGVYRFTDVTHADVTEAVKARPTHPKIMADWVPIRVRQYSCTDSPSPGPGDNPPRPHGCGRGAKLITDRRGWLVNFLTPLATDLFPMQPDGSR